MNICTRKIEVIFENTFSCQSGAQIGGFSSKQCWGQQSRDTVSLITVTRHFSPMNSMNPI